MAKTLENLRNLAYRAHSNISFSPEVRAESIVSDYSAELDHDLETIRSLGASDEQIERYKASYILKLSAWLSAKSRCLSSMITGPANFPVRRAEKANQSERNRSEDFTQWREKVLKAYERHASKQTIIEAGGPIAIAKKDLESAKLNHERMKAGNKRIAEAVKKGEDISLYLMSEFNIAPHMIDWTMKFGFGLSNNLAYTKRLEAKVKELEVKEQRAESGVNQTIEIPGGILTVDHQLDWITVKHETKPAPEIISQLKSNGFKWSPHYGCWMRKITGNALFAVKHSLLPALNKAA